MSAIQIAALIVALLVTSGALAFYIKFGTRLAFAERDSKDALASTVGQGKELAALQARQMLMEQTVREIHGSLAKLSGIDEIKATCEVLKDRVEALRSSNADARLEVKELRGDVRTLLSTSKPA